uniref:Phosphatidylinositol glycan anchor biosynthesis, class Q n=1 Tax=Eptatretus burgeri TaxID=7764 RepID=A0A8C4R5D0_EPTBU
MAAKVYFPSCCLPAQSAVLLGCKLGRRDSFLVLATMSFPFTPNRVKSFLASVAPRDTPPWCDFRPEVLGICNVSADWRVLDDESSLTAHSLCKIFNGEAWLEVELHAGSTSPSSCNIYRRDTNGHYNLRSPRTVVFAHYNQREAVTVRWLAEDSSDFTSMEEQTADVTKEPSEMALFFTALSCNEQIFLPPPCEDDLEEKQSTGSSVCLRHWQDAGPEGSIVVELGKAACRPIRRVGAWFLALVAPLFICRLWTIAPLPWIGDCLSTWLQLHHQHDRLRVVFSPPVVKVPPRLTPPRCADMICSMLLDSLLGLLLISHIYPHGHLEAATDALPVFTQAVAGHLQELLQWLMGAPAGLKLNSTLACTLGRFFLYHIHLWLSYVSMLVPYVGPVLWYGGLLATLGVSLLLSMLIDITSLLTVHVYCFYVYAARLYRLQVCGLSSLWRLFRGKKWNVLRHRVDSCQYDVDQLFLGTLLFTILLFLLPTTALFYLVFTLLRLMVIGGQVVLSRTIWLINGLPVFSLVQRLLCGYNLAGGVEFEVLTQTSKSILNVSMQIQPLSVWAVLRRFWLPSRVMVHRSPNPTQLVATILSGELVQPWYRGGSGWG